MKSFFLPFLISINLWAATPPESIPTGLSSESQKKIKESGDRLLQLDCPFLLQIFHPKDTTKSHLALCIQTVSQARGIFAAQGCIAALAEPDSQIVNPFYGSKGHWGMEGPCSTDGMKKKLKDPEIEKTVNPFTSFRMKREEGFGIRLLKDDLKLWEDIKPLITPKKK